MKTLLSKLPCCVKLGLAVCLFLGASTQSAVAVFIDPAVPIPTQLLSFGPDGINGDVFIPLTGAATTSSAAGAPAATVDNYGWVKSNIRIDLSMTNPSNGQSSFSVPFGNNCIQGGMAGDVANGDTVCVDSFFDVFFDITITDIDDTASFFGGNGPASLMKSNEFAQLQHTGSCTVDTSSPNLGCLPPEGFPYIGFSEIVMNLAKDVNNNGFNDIMKLQLGAYNVGGVTNTFINGNQVVSEYDATISGTGAVMDEKDDPPFSFTLTGPTTASQTIVYPSAAVPEPTTYMLFGVGIALMGLRRRRQK